MNPNNQKTLQYQRPRFLLSAFCFLCFHGMHTIPIVEVSATTFECFDESGNMVFTDSPTQLLECRELHFGSEPQKPSSLSSKPRRKPSRPDAQISAIPSSPPKQPNPSSAHMEILPTSNDYPSPTITIPITNMDGAVVVRAVLNRINQVNLLVDPSQTMTIFSYDLGKQLGLLPPSREGTKENGSLENKQIPKVTQVGMIQIGAAKAREVPVRIDHVPNAKPEVSGLLGMSFFKKFRADFNVERGYLRLQQLYEGALIQEGPSK